MYGGTRAAMLLMVLGFSDYKNWAGPTTFIESAFAEFRHEFCLLNDYGGPVKGTAAGRKIQKLCVRHLPHRSGPCIQRLWSVPREQHASPASPVSSI